MERPAGSLVVGSSARDCCRWCTRLIHGTVYEVADAPSPKRDREHVVAIEGKSVRVAGVVWPGKTNEAQNGRDTNWRGCIPLHPNCRCRWTAYGPAGQARLGA